VQFALEQRSGPYWPFLELMDAIEQASMFDLRSVSESLLLSPADVNRALLKALGNAHEIK
jgi:EAL and modified HD-GYP domain-containing signal transduction protein